jgi:membrane associated rhomboid family serine protease
VVCTTIELVLTASDLGWIGERYWRLLTYNLWAFWLPILEGRATLFAGQEYTMFLSYAVLHGGLLHLTVNMIALWSFGSAIIRRVGQTRFLLACAITAFGGSAGFALMSTNMAPMVGASGALFGLLGLWICWDYMDRRHFGEKTWGTYRALFYLVIYNLVFWIALSGRLAWETHLGGFIAGWVLGIYWGRDVYMRRRRTADASVPPSDAP